MRIGLNLAARQPNLQKLYLVFDAATPTGAWYIEFPENVKRGAGELRGCPVTDAHYPSQKYTKADEEMDNELDPSLTSES